MEIFFTLCSQIKCYENNFFLSRFNFGLFTCSWQGHWEHFSGWKDKLGALVGLEFSQSFLGPKPKCNSFLYQLDSSIKECRENFGRWKVKQGCSLHRLAERMGTPFFAWTKAAFCCCRIFSHLILGWRFCIMCEAQISTCHIRRQHRNRSLVKQRNRASLSLLVGAERMRDSPRFLLTVIIL